MRSPVLVAAGLVAVVAAVTAGSVSAGRSSTDATRTQLDDYYLFHAKFTLRYEVAWQTKEGSASEDCSTWRADSGTTKMIAKDAAWVQEKKRGKKLTRTEGIPGSITIYARSLRNDKTGPWASGSAVGHATVTVDRNWVQRGGVNWSGACGSPAPEPFQPTPDDCRTKTFQTDTAAVIPQTRRRFDTLADVMNRSSARGGRAALAFSIPGPAPLYKRCRTHSLAPDLVSNFGFAIGTADKLELARAQPGRDTEVVGKSSGECSYAIAQDEKCTYELELVLDVRRWKPGERFP